MFNLGARILVLSMAATVTKSDLYQPLIGILAAILQILRLRCYPTELLSSEKGVSETKYPFL